MSDAMELKVQTVTNCHVGAGDGSRSPGRAARTRNHSPISLDRSLKLSHPDALREGKH